MMGTLRALLAGRRIERDHARAAAHSYRLFVARFFVARLFVARCFVARCFVTRCFVARFFVARCFVAARVFTRSSVRAARNFAMRVSNDAGIGSVKEKRAVPLLLSSARPSSCLKWASVAPVIG